MEGSEVGEVRTSLRDRQHLEDVFQLCADRVGSQNLQAQTQAKDELGGNLYVQAESVRGVSWSEVATVPKRKSHRELDLNFSLNTEVNIWKGWKESGGTK